MKRINLLLLVFILALALCSLASCSEPAEPPRGTTWTYGTEVPTDTTDATVGDFYMKTDTNEVYVLEEDGWVNLASLDGKDGVDGKDGQNGTTWLYDTKAPTDADGENGNFWLNTVTFELYQKSAGKWELVADLK